MRCLLALLSLLPLARAQDGPPPPSVEIGPVADAQRAWAEGLAGSVERELKRVVALRQPGRAAVKLEGQGTRVELETLVIERLKFASEALARQWAALDPVHRRVESPEVTWATAVASAGGDERLPELMERVAAAWPPGGDAPPDLGAKLGAGVEELREQVTAVEQIPGVAAWESTRVELDGLVVERRKSPERGPADPMFADELEAGAEGRLVIDQRGGELLILSGALLDSPGAAARAIDAGWAGAAVPAQRLAIGVRGPAPAGEEDPPAPLAVLSLDPGTLFHAIGSRHLRRARAAEAGQKEGAPARWKFQDPELLNHVMVQDGDVIEVQLTSVSVLLVRSASPQVHAAERGYLLELLQALGITLPPPSTERVALPGER